MNYLEYVEDLYDLCVEASESIPQRQEHLVNRISELNTKAKKAGLNTLSIDVESINKIRSDTLAANSAFYKQWNENQADYELKSLTSDYEPEAEGDEYDEHDPDYCDCDECADY